MRTTPRRTAVACLAALGATALLVGCSADGDADGSASVPMGWVEKTDEQTQVRFALPPPVSGPEDTRRPGRSTAVASHSYGSRSGDLGLAVQLLTTPEDPDALSQELPPRQVPLRVLEQVASEGDYETEVLSNDAVPTEAEPTYDSHLRVTSADETALWWMRTQATADVVVVTQVVAFADAGGSPGDLADLEAQAETAFDRLTGTVVLP